MKNFFSFFITAYLMFSFTGFAQAEVSMNSARVGSTDVAALAEFYKTAFGMHEVQRIEMGGGSFEVMLNFGSSVDEAMANPAAQVVIMPSDEVLDDPIAHLIFNVTDINATVTDINAAGGALEVGPFEFADTGIFIGMGIDPQGNRFELLQQPAQ